jgi:PAS domain S-box-containing protein
MKRNRVSSNRSGTNRRIPFQGNPLLELILEASPDLVYLFDRLEQRYVFVSGRSKDLLGYTPREVQQLRGEGIERLIHPADLARVRQHFGKQAMLRDDEVSMSTYRVMHASGDYRTLRCRQKVFSRTGDGAAKCILGIATDITDETNRQRELKELRAEILRIRDDERRRIALHMHDNVMQHLVGAAMLLKSIEGALPAKTNATNALHQVQSSLSSALRDVLDPLIS